MSIRIFTLVLGAKPFGVDGQRSVGTNRRLVMISLAERADDHGACFPGLEDTAARTELGRSTTARVLADLIREGWIGKETRPGFGSLYRLNVARLLEHQRNERTATRSHRLSCPVERHPATGQMPLAVPSEALSCPVKPFPNKKNRINPLPLRGEPIADAPKKQKRTPKQPSSVHPLREPVKQLLEAVGESLGLRYPWDVAENSQLKRKLRTPGTDLAFWQKCIENWRLSDKKHHVVGSYAAVITAILRYQQGPLGQFHEVQASGKPTNQPLSIAEKRARAARSAA